MVLESLRKAFSLLTSTPVLWLPGLLIGLLGVADLAAQFYFGEFVAGRMWIIELIAVPFFVAAMMQVIRTGQKSLGAFLEGGIKYYFRILIPTVVISFAVILTVILLLVPLSILGLALEMVPFIAAGSAVGISFFTFFYDAAAAFEDAKVFESIRRSIELVVKNPGTTIIFYLVLLAVSAAVLLIFALIWTAALYESLMPLIEMDTAMIESFTPDDLIALIGPAGLAVTAVVYMAAATIIFPFIYTYKSTFFQKYAHNIEENPQGEYDSKGRWYKY
jgi:hypothetical protein